MKILHLIPSLFGVDGGIGGAERYAVELVRALRSQGDVRLVTFGERRARVSADGVSVEVVKGWKVRGQEFNRLGPGILGFAAWAEVIHCHQHHVLASSLLALCGRATGRPVVATDHGGGGFDFSWYLNTDRLFAAHLHVSDFSLRQADHAPSVRSAVVHGGVDAHRFVPGRWDSPRDRVLFVGRVLPHKGVHNLIEALPDHLYLDVIGPFLDERYVRELRRMAVGRRVTFHGTVDGATLESAYRHALCIVLPSVREDLYGAVTEVPELLGQTLLEGMSSGIPAVCSDAGAMEEVVLHRRTGLVVPQDDVGALRDALSALADDQVQSHQWGVQGRARVLEQFTWESVASKCMATYRSLLRTRPGSGLAGGGATMWRQGPG